MSLQDTIRRILQNEYRFLNGQQRQAVFTTKGPLLILAGAGSGKTTVLVNKIEFAIKYGNAYFAKRDETAFLETDKALLEAYAVQPNEAFADRITELIKTENAQPYSVMAITFTNKAANELKERLAKRLGPLADDIWAGTFHSICVRILRRYIDRIGYSSDFAIYDTDDQKKLIKGALKELNLEEKNFPVNAVLSVISKAKDSAQTAEEFLSYTKNDFRLNAIGRVYQIYEKKLKSANALDFDDLIMLTVKLLDSDSEVKEYYQNKFHYVYVDEYQDTNQLQYKLVSTLVAKHRNFTVVGDDDQSIYKFRGATIENILNFERQYSDAKVIKLEQNYRSTSYILNSANSIISNNCERKGKELWTSNGEGEKLSKFVAENEYEEGRFIASEIQKCMAEKSLKYSDFAVLYRTNSQSSAIEEAVMKSGIPYKIFAGMKFYERKEVKDVVSYLWVLVNENDDLRLKRIINEPKRSIGDTTIATAESIAMVKGESLYSVIRRADNLMQLSRACGFLISFVNMIEDIKEKMADLLPSETVRLLLEKTGYMRYCKEQDEADGRDRTSNVEVLVSNIENYETKADNPSIIGFLQEVSLASELDALSEDGNYVTLMTMHSAKGLEFPVVFLSGLEEGLFPSARSFEEIGGIEEERRLAYVAVTRAKQKLYLTRAQSRRSYYGPDYHMESRFLKEIPVDNIIELNKLEKPAKSIVKPKFRDYGHVQKYNATTVTSKPAKDTVALSAGDKVSHLTFGDGVILSVKEMSGDALVEVKFEKVGIKKLMQNYANLQKK